MACLGTTVTATGTTAKRIAYPRGLSSINNNLRPSGSFSLLPPLPQLSTSTRLSNGNVSSGGRGRRQVLLITRAEANTMTSIEKSGIKIIKNPPESKLADLGVRSWPKYVYSLLEFIFSFQSATAILLLLLIFLVQYFFLPFFFFFFLFSPFSVLIFNLLQFFFISFEACFVLCVLLHHHDKCWYSVCS